MALAAGVNAKVVSGLLGHATVAFTLNTYVHAIPALDEEAAAKVAQLIESADPHPMQERPGRDRELRQGPELSLS